MKKTLFVLGIAVVMLLVMVPAAFATQGDSTYLTPTVGANPHGGYVTNSQKCGVCHAVHHAGPIGDGSGSEALLKSTRASACTYCHITNGVSSKIVYAGSSGKYSGTDLNTAHNTYSSGTAGVACIDCHQVHAAASMMTSSTELTYYILRIPTTDTVMPTLPLSGVTSATVRPAALDDTATSLAKWCSLCHAYYMQAKNNASHVMTSADGTHAFQASTYCQSCHNSNTVSGVASASAFPHYTDGVRFLTSAASSAGPSVAATSADQDGVCLRCHVNSGATLGIGISF